MEESGYKEQRGWKGRSCLASEMVTPFLYYSCWRRPVCKNVRVLFSPRLEVRVTSSDDIAPDRVLEVRASGSVQVRLQVLSGEHLRFDFHISQTIKSSACWHMKLFLVTFLRCWRYKPCIHAAEWTPAGILWQGKAELAQSIWTIYSTHTEVANTWDLSQHAPTVWTARLGGQISQ